MLKKMVEAKYGTMTDTEYQNALMLTTSNVLTWAQIGVRTYLGNIVESIVYHIVEMRK